MGSHIVDSLISKTYNKIKNITLYPVDIADLNAEPFYRRWDVTEDEHNVVSSGKCNVKKEDKAECLLHRWIQTLNGEPLLVSDCGLISLNNEHRGKEETFVVKFSVIDGEQSLSFTGEKVKYPYVMYAQDMLLIDKCTLSSNQHCVVSKVDTSLTRHLPTTLLGIRNDTEMMLRYLLPSATTKKGFFLFIGSRGLGKTHVLHFIGSTLRQSCIATVYLNCRRLHSSSPHLRSVLDEISSIFDEAKARAPAVVILDELDELAPNVSTDKGMTDPDQENVSKLVADYIKALLRNEVGYQYNGSAHAPGSVTVVISCKERTSLNESLCIPELLHDWMELKEPDVTMRTDFLKNRRIDSNALVLCKNESVYLGKKTEVR
mmetsp:Transcript_17366/g.39210  ORF Transcript_17366/g.39210 Transcript_17366/m.39210 type:complete len:375 (+) Transcript_17366:995-2119(+)